MRRLFSLLLSASAICSSVIFSVQFLAVDASAALAGGRYMTVADAQSVFGSEISGKYFNGTDYADCTFLYDRTATMWTINTAGSRGDYLSSSPTFMIYAARFSANTNPQYITVEVQPSYSIFDTSQIHTCIALSSGSSNANNPVTPSASFQSPSWDWVIGGSSVHLENSDTISGGGHKAGLDFKLNDVHTWFSFVPLDFTSQSSLSGYSIRADFFGNGSISGGIYYLAIGLPYIDSDSTASNGTFTTVGSGSGGGDINVNVDVDMEETNGLLGDIKGLLQGIVNGIKNLFVPSEAALIDFKDDMQHLLEEHLGGIYEAVDIISGIWTRFENVLAKSSIDIPACEIPLAGETFTLGPYSVPLKVQGMPRIFYDGLAWIIDFLAVASFLRMCRNKLEIFLNPDSEVVQDDS